MTLQRLIQDARREGKIEALVELYLSGDLPLSMAANKSGLSEEEFLESCLLYTSPSPRD